MSRPLRSQWGRSTRKGADDEAWPPELFTQSMLKPRASQVTLIDRALLFPLALISTAHETQSGATWIAVAWNWWWSLCSVNSFVTIDGIINNTTHVTWVDITTNWRVISFRTEHVYVWGWKLFEYSSIKLSSVLIHDEVCEFSLSLFMTLCL